MNAIESAPRSLGFRVRELHENNPELPLLDTSGLSGKACARAKKLQKARDKLLAGHTLDACARAAGVSSRRYQRIMERYVTLADDGKPSADRAFKSHWRPKKHPVRVKPFDPEKVNVWGSYTGEFRRLMHDRATLRTALVSALRRKGKVVLTVNRLVGRELRKLLVRLLEIDGLAATEYPLNTKDKGLKALRQWIKDEFLPKYASDWMAAENGEKSPAQAKAEPKLKPTVVTEYEPYVDWVLDECKADVKAAIEMINAQGDIDVVHAECIRVLRLIETGYNTTLAIVVIYGRAATCDDLGNLLWRALNGWTLKDVLPGLKVIPTGGFPVHVLPELKWRRPRYVFLDNALAHLSAKFGVIVEHVLGAELRAGFPADPLERPAIESKFAVTARRLFHQLVGTTGTDPKDPQAKRYKHLKPDGMLRVEEVDHAYEVMVQNENGTAATAAHGIPPLERLRRALIQGRITAPPVSLSCRTRHTFFPGKPVRVHANPDENRRPYIIYDRVRYTGSNLQKRYDLDGKYVEARADPDSLCVLILFHKDVEIARVSGEGRWGVIPHDSRMRRMSLRNIDDAQKGEMPQDGALLALFARLQRDAPTTPSAALQLAHCLAVLGRHLQGENIDAHWLSQVLAGGSLLEVFGHLSANTNESPPTTAEAPAVEQATPPPLRMTPRPAIRA